MPQAKMYNIDGKEVGKVDLDEVVFNVAMNLDLVHQALTTQLANGRQVLAHAKDRGEVRGGGKKPWRQKGTGRARHGSIRSPLWIGGGVTFGPTKEKNFKKKINKTMKQKAIFMALSAKLKEGQLIVLDNLIIERAKTKEMMNVIDKVITDNNKKSVLVVLPINDLAIMRAAKNLTDIKVVRADSLNIVDLLTYKYVLMPQQSMEIIKKTYVKNI